MAATEVGRLIRLFLPPFPPPPSSRRTFSAQSFLREDEHCHCRPFAPPKTTRRSALLLLPALSALAHIPPSGAAAFSFGVPGPKEWLREQKKKSANFVLAPIDASRRTLRSAYLMLASDPVPQNVVDAEELRRLLSSAARDCVPQQRSSLVELQSRSGVEVCTFRLLVKNAASLLDKNDPVKLETEAMLDDLIRSFSSLGAIVDNSSFQLTENREKFTSGLADTISALDKFELGIRNCLGV